MIMTSFGIDYMYLHDVKRRKGNKLHNHTNIYTQKYTDVELITLAPCTRTQIPISETLNTKMAPRSRYRSFLVEISDPKAQRAFGFNARYTKALAKETYYYHLADYSINPTLKSDLDLLQQ